MNPFFFMELQKQLIESMFNPYLSVYDSMFDAWFKAVVKG